MPEINFSITIDKSLVHDETNDEIKTRVPGTIGENVRFLWLKRDEIKEVNDGKTILTSLKENGKYLLYDKDGNLAENVTGHSLYSQHYDQVNKRYIKLDKRQTQSQSNEKTDDNESEKNSVVHDVLKSENDYTDDNAVTSNINVAILANIHDKCDLKIAKLQDKNEKLNLKKQKLNDKGNRTAEFVDLVQALEGAIPKPIFLALNLLAEEKRQKVCDLHNKACKCQDKIYTNLNKIEKYEHRASLCVKINTFLDKMKSPEGRRENFINGIEEFRSISIKNTTNKFNNVQNKLEDSLVSYNKTHYATEKIKLQKQINKLSNKKEKLRNKLISLDALKNKFDDIKNMSDDKLNSVIDRSCKNIVAELSNNPQNAKNQAETVVNACSRAIDESKKELSQSQDKDNYLKNAEMSVEDDYNSIDGVINNGNKEQEYEKLKKSERKEVNKSPLSRKQIKNNADKIAQNEQQRNTDDKVKNKGQEL